MRLLLTTDNKYLAHIFFSFERNCYSIYSGCIGLNLIGLLDASIFYLIIHVNVNRVTSQGIISLPQNTLYWYWWRFGLWTIFDIGFPAGPKLCQKNHIYQPELHCVEKKLGKRKTSTHRWKNQSYYLYPKIFYSCEKMYMPHDTQYIFLIAILHIIILPHQLTWFMDLSGYFHK